MRLRPGSLPDEAPQSGILLYQTEDGRTRIQCRFEDETVWLTQKLMAELFQIGVGTVNHHLKAIFAERELKPEATVRRHRIVQNEGVRQISREVEHYNLEAIIAVGFRVRSHRGTQLRQWAVGRLTEYMVKGFTMDDERLKNPLGKGEKDYFDEQLERIRDIRSSERRFYQKVLDIYATSVDYAPNTELSQQFFATVQNKMHWAAHGHTQTGGRAPASGGRRLRSLRQALAKTPASEEIAEAAEGINAGVSRISHPHLESSARPMSSDKKLHIRNGTAEFLIFTRQAGEDGIEVRVADETVWLSQKLMAALFEVDLRTVNEHLGNIFATGEQRREATLRKFRIVQTEGAREVAREVEHYNLDAIIAVGFRVNSARATEFRRWAAGVLRDFAIRGYVLDKERLKNGALLNPAYFETLLAEIREIRASERKFYQKITDIYATALDYDATAETTRAFFAVVQNKLHHAIHGHTAAELIVSRANAAKPAMGLTSWKNAPGGKILKPDVVVAKNYLNAKELKSLDRFVTMYLDYAEDQAERNIPMTMHDWATKLNAFLRFNEREVLDDPGKVTQEVAKAFAESEFEKYRVVQDRLFESDFDRHMKQLLGDSDAAKAPAEDASEKPVAKLLRPKKSTKPPKA